MAQNGVCCIGYEHTAHVSVFTGVNTREETGMANTPCETWLAGCWLVDFMA